MVSFVNPLPSLIRWQCVYCQDAVFVLLQCAHCNHSEFLLIVIIYNISLDTNSYWIKKINLFILIGGSLLYNTVVVLPYIDMNQPWVYMCPPSWIPLPPPSPSHPSGSSQCTGPERPISCIKPGLKIYFTYGNIHVSMVFSQIIPLLPSPTESKVCSFSLRLFSCLIYRVIVTIFLNSIYMH